MGDVGVKNVISSTQMSRRVIKEYKYYSGRPVSPISTGPTLDINPNLAPLTGHISVNTPVTDL